MRKIPNRGKRAGAIVPLVAIFLPVLLILAGFVVNLSYVELTRTQLRIATDSASRAAGHRLAATGDTQEAAFAARQATQRNLVAGAPLQLDDQDIIFGVATRPNNNSRYQFIAGATPPNSVQILGRRTSDSQSGEVSLIIPMSGGIDSFQTVQSATSSQVKLDVVLVLDRSGSMAYAANEESDALFFKGILPASAPPGWQFCDQVPSGSRWIDLGTAIEVFNSVLQSTAASEHVGLATYATDSKHELNLTTDYSKITDVINSYSQQFCIGATNIGSGIQEGLNVITNPSFARKGAAKVMIVMTDGRHNTGPEPSIAAAAVAQEGILIYTITFSSEAEQFRMVDVANIGGGIHYHANSREELQEAFEKIANSLPTILTE